jgi:hypothetical protein
MEIILHPYVGFVAYKYQGQYKPKCDNEYFICNIIPANNYKQHLKDKTDSETNRLSNM